MKNVSIIIVLLCLLSAGCRSSRQVSKTSGRTVEQSVSRDTGSTQRVATDDRERNTEFVDHQWEDLEFTQVHERDTAGNEKTTTSIRGHRGRDRNASTRQRESRTEQSDSTAGRRQQTARQEESAREKDVSRQPAPVAGGPGAWRVWILLALGCILMIVWPEPVRKAGRWILERIKNVLAL